MKTVLVKFSKLMAALALTGLVWAAQPAKAASVKMEVKVSGISNWVLVDYNAWPKYGGRVVWDSSRGCYITDDVARGETMRVTLTPQAGETPAGWYDVYSYGNSRYVRPFAYVGLPFMDSFVVPLDPSFDNVHVEIYTPEYVKTPRIPIGPRVH